MKFKKNWDKIIGVLLILIFLYSAIFFFSKSQDYKFDILYEYETVPSIDLIYNYPNEIKGFVKFDNINDQPRDSRQYYIIKALNQKDDLGLPLFSIEEILKFSYIPPKSISIETMHVKNIINNEIIVLEDEDKNQYFINTKENTVNGIDAGGDKTTLMTSNSDYKDFITSWLK